MDAVHYLFGPFFSKLRRVHRFLYADKYPAYYLFNATSDEVYLYC